MILHFKFVYFLWQFNIIDTLGMVNCFVNIGMQYGSIVVTSAGVKHLSELTPKILIEPFVGLAVSFRYIKAGDTLAIRRARAATIGSFLSLSAALAGTSTPAANGGLGSTIAVQVDSMRAALAARGGGTSLPFILEPSLENYEMVYVSLKTVIHPYRENFALKSKITIDRMFESHTLRRYLQGSSEKFRMVGSTCLTPIVSTRINTTILISSNLVAVVSVALIGFTTLTLIALRLFHLSERKRFKNKNNKNFTSVTTFIIDIDKQ